MLCRAKHEDHYVYLSRRKAAWEIKMENTYTCPVCGSAELKYDGASYSCRYCRGVFTENELRSARRTAEAPTASNNGASAGNGAMIGGSSAARSPLFGGTVGVGGNGFSAPPEELILEFERRAAASRQAAESASVNNGGSGNRLRGNESGTRASSSGASGAGRNVRGSDRGRRPVKGSGNTNTGSEARSGSSASDSENNVRFLDNVSLMNDLAYELVNGNANAWANIARDRGIINSKQHTEIKYIVATRNCIAHGSGDTVRITAELVSQAKNYYDLMRRTASEIK